MSSITQDELRKISEKGLSPAGKVQLAKNGARYVKVANKTTGKTIGTRFLSGATKGSAGGSPRKKISKKKSKSNERIPSLSNMSDQKISDSRIKEFDDYYKQQNELRKKKTMKMAYDKTGGGLVDSISEGFNSISKSVSNMFLDDGEGGSAKGGPLDGAEGDTGTPGDPLDGAEPEPEPADNPLDGAEGDAAKAAAAKAKAEAEKAEKAKAKAEAEKAAKATEAEDLLEKAAKEAKEAAEKSLGALTGPKDISTETTGEIETLYKNWKGEHPEVGKVINTWGHLLVTGLISCKLTRLLETCNVVTCVTSW